MPKTPVLLLALLTALTANAFSQSYQFTATAGGDETFVRPRRVVATVAGVSAGKVNTASVERTAFEILNQKRTEKGLKRLTWSNELASIARSHSHNMADLKFFGHRGLDNKMVSDRADDIGLKKWRAIGENIAFNRGYIDPIAKAVEVWLDSPSHRRNLMNDDWRESAVGVAVAPDGSYYFTQVFMLRK